MSKKSYKRNQNRLYREIKKRIIAEQKMLRPVSIVKCERKIETLKVRNMVPEYMEQTEEISFLKKMQLQTISNMKDEDIGNSVASVFGLKGW